MGEDLKEVQGQYLDYPYPPRNPEDEKHRLLTVLGENLGEINHWLFSGAADFPNFRILVAGGGTGDSLIYLAEQLKNTTAEIVYLDFSKSSMKIAQERAKVRGLTNVTWINDSILNILNLDLGKFDYINCIGVLHHLENPRQGLRILKDSLKDNGGMSIMVYGLYGRTAVYHIQALMQMINKNTTTRKKEVENAWTIVKNLPDTNWYMKGRSKQERSTLFTTSTGRINDHEVFGDSGLYDLFLHKQDKAYSIPQLHEFIEQQNLHLIEFVEPEIRAALKLETYIKDKKLLSELISRPIEEQQAMAEILSGSIIKHHVYLSKNKNAKAKFTDRENVPYFILHASDTASRIANTIKRLGAPPPGALLQDSWTTFNKKHTVHLPVSKYTLPLFHALVQNEQTEKTFAEIHRLIEAELNTEISNEDFQNEIKNILSIYEKAGILLLKRKGLHNPIPIAMGRVSARPI